MPNATHVEAVRNAARKLGVLGNGDVLVGLHSLLIIDMLLDLEGAIGAPIPTATLSQKDFESVETLAALLGRVTA